MKSILIAVLSLISLTYAQGVWQAPSPAELLCPAGKAGKKGSPEQKKAAQLLKMLQAVEKGGGADAADEKGLTALMLASEMDNRMAVCYLLAKFAETSLQDKTGKSAINYARSGAVRKLINACSVGSGSVPAEKENRDRELREKGLTDPAKIQQALLRLVEKSDYAEISKLLRYGIEANAIDTPETTLLQIPGITPECIAFFVRKGYNINAKAKGAASPLPELPVPTAKLALALGLRIGEQDIPAKFIGAVLTDDLKTVKALLKKDSTLATAVAKNGSAPLSLAQSAGMVQALIDAGADAKAEGLLSGMISRSADDPRDAGVVQALIAAGAPLPEEENLLLTLLDSGSGDAKTAQCLIQAGLDAKAADAQGNTALHLAAAHGHLGALKALLAAGANATAENAAGDTPLIHCLRQASRDASPDLVDIAKALVKAGANPKAKAQDGQSAASLAKPLGIPALLKALKTK